MSKKMTAVEELAYMLLEKYRINVFEYDEFKQAKAMEKEQNYESFFNGLKSLIDKKNFEQYYKETYEQE